MKFQAIPLESVKEGEVIDKPVSANTDLLNDITADRDTDYFVVQIISDTAGYPKVKLKPTGSNATIIGGLNESSVLTANSWYELWFTVKEGDKINLQFSAAATITARVFRAMTSG